MVFLSGGATAEKEETNNLVEKRLIRGELRQLRSNGGTESINVWGHVTGGTGSQQVNNKETKSIVAWVSTFQPIQQTICIMLQFWRQLRTALPATLHLRLVCTPQHSLSDMGHEPCPVSLHPLRDGLSEGTCSKGPTPR